MRIATWNVNSLNARLGRVVEWVEYAKPDILCMQETKVADGSFPAMAFAAAGYESAPHGNGRWNGVAILSRVGLDDVHAGFASGADEQGSRIVSAVCGGIKIHSVYVPNGRSVDSEFYQAKLAWLAELRAHLEATADPGEPVAVCGDFNVAPEDRDVFDPKKFVGATHVTQPERDAVVALEKWGMEDAFRRVYPDTDRLYSYWDYRAGDFHQHRGMRIDLVLATRPVADRVTWAVVDRNARKGTGPSDHAPVIVDPSD